MKIGIKTYFDAEFAEYFKDKADFLEVMAISGKDYDFLEGYPLPIVIHAMHQGFGVNPADSSIFEKNKEAIDFAVELADRFGAKKIIFHPGNINNENCSRKNAVDMITGSDQKVILENLPSVNNGFCVLPDDTKKFISDVGKGFCFDINHAINAATSVGEDYMKVIREFVLLAPAHYHIGGQKVEGYNTHLAFEDSDIPLRKIFELLPSDAEVTLEVTNDIGKTENDLNLVRGLVG